MCGGGKGTPDFFGSCEQRGDPDGGFLLPRQVDDQAGALGDPITSTSEPPTTPRSASSKPFH